MKIDTMTNREEVTAKMLDLIMDGDEGVSIPDEILLAAARDTFNGASMMGVLLDKGDTGEIIKEEILVEACDNFEKGKEVVKVLLERRSDKIVITDRVVQAAARNENIGKSIVELLLQERGSEIIITDKIVQAAAGNKRGGKEVMELLLETRGSEVMLTEGVVQAAAGNMQSGGEIIKLLLIKRGSNLISDGLVKAFAKECNTNGVNLLLKERGSEVKITEGVLQAAVSNRNAAIGVTTLLLEKRGSEVKITEGVLQAAVSNSNAAREVTELLLKKRGSEVKITEGVLQAAASNGETARDVINLLLKERSSEIMITEGLIQAVAEHSWGARDIMMLLIGFQLKHGSGCTILHEAARAGSSHIVSLLLSHGIDTQILDSNKRTALHNATEAGSLGTIWRLLKCNADIHAVDKDGRTVFDIIPESGSPYAYWWLLRKYASVGHIEKRGKADLHDTTRTEAGTKSQQAVFSVDRATENLPSNYALSEIGLGAVTVPVVPQDVRTVNPRHSENTGAHISNPGSQQFIDIEIDLIRQLLIAFVDTVLDKLVPVQTEKSVLPHPLPSLDQDINTCLNEYCKKGLKLNNSPVPHTTLQIIQHHRQDIVQMLHIATALYLQEPINQAGRETFSNRRRSRERTISEKTMEALKIIDNIPVIPWVKRPSSLSWQPALTVVRLQTSFEDMSQMIQHGEHTLYITKQLRKILFQLEPASMESIRHNIDVALAKDTKSLEHSVTFNLYWELPSFMQLEFGNCLDIRSVLTVTGESVNAYAATCLNYCKDQWGDGSCELLDALQVALVYRGRVTPTKRTILRESDSIEVTCTDHKLPSSLYGVNSPDSMSIKAQGSQKFLVQIAQQLVWLTASF